jgi:hypothetical protein
MIPYDHIAATADRRWTSRLLDRLVTPELPEAELDDLVGALQAVSDLRSVGPLETVLVDATRPAPVREAAGAVLGGMQYLTLDVPEDKLRRWWREGDAVLRRHALSCMDRVDCPDIVLQVATDPSHELHALAIGRMTFLFDEPEHERIKTAALAHPDPRVREAAAVTLFWDEPAVAEGPLIEAAGDSVPEVAAEAANTLEYYPSLRVIRRLHELLYHADARVREEAGDSFQSIRYELLSRLGGKDRQVAQHLREWLQPVRSLLAFTGDEMRADEDEGPSTPREQPVEVMPLGHLLALLADADVSPVVLADRLRSNRWSGYAEADRSRLRPVLLTHADQLVREQAAWVFAAWRDVNGLLGLVRQGDFCVRKAAVYSLGQLPSTPGLAELAWEHLHRADVLGVHATETLNTFVQHADPVLAVARLGVIVGDHGRREGLRVAAVHHLASLGAAEEVGQLAGLLHEPPMVTWALHLALLDAITDLGLPPPDISHLRDVDNLRVQEAVAVIGP